jgi:cellulose biosynthesis protein BcsQ
MTNLAAAFADKGECVLTVDLDYQGSHSSLMQLQQREVGKEPESLIDYIILEEELDPNWHKQCLRRVTDNLYYIPAFYNFELVERRVEYQWALGATGDDVRYRLARALLSPDLQGRFDRILIDAPPRFTLGFVNGFCAATHLYVPTQADSLAGAAVGSFARQFKELRAVVNPRIKWSGIIGTLTTIRPQDTLTLPDAAAEAAGVAEREAQDQLGTKETLFIRRPVIAYSAGLARAADHGVGYLNDSRLRPMFDELAKVIETKAPSRKTRP